MFSHTGNVRKNCCWGSLYSGWKMIFCKCEFVRFNWKKAVNLLLTTTMFHKNQTKCFTACIKHRLCIYFFQEIIPFYKKFHIFWNLKMSISAECHPWYSSEYCLPWHRKRMLKSEFERKEQVTKQTFICSKAKIEP